MITSTAPAKPTPWRIVNSDSRGIGLDRRRPTCARTWWRSAQGTTQQAHQRSAATASANGSRPLSTPTAARMPIAKREADSIITRPP